jgi:hypothetical protein
MNKNIKIAVTALVLLVTVNIARGQSKEFTIKLSDPSKAGKLTAEFFYGSVKVVGYPGKDVIISASGLYDANKVTISEKNNLVNLTIEKPLTLNFVIKVPEKFSVTLKIQTAGDIFLENVSGDHDVALVNGNITMMNIGGTVSANTKHGNIKVDMNSVKKDSPLAFSNVMGIIEVSLPANLKADVKLQTEFAKVQSDFDIVASESKDISKNNAAGKINGGGSDILMRSVGGNIYLKKKK